ncbi:MAG: M28 family peptidase [Bacteroidia bacterium]|nr:M28 family peptidase [Bacteroidia bacterium]MCX7764422.1 M28 family peptidase [Bacteroidia bacterium]MDW8056709.1 M28 family peptidase [Bacteroidia bacterium]
MRKLLLGIKREQRFWLSGGLMWLIVACRSSSPPPLPSSPPPVSIPADRPAFSADSAYAHIVQQLKFGMRIPGTPAHKKTGDWLVATLQRYGARVHQQVGTYKGTPIRNIIASFGPEGGKRILLSAHWDSRPYADRESQNAQAPVPGANDGASGVAVLLELARLMAQKPLPYPVDIIFWDAEDLGREGVEDSYCLGSQYWLTAPQPYPPRAYAWGIHLDMVGGRNATFFQEGYSRKHAPFLVERLWAVADQLGYKRYFPPLPAEPIVDDPFYLSERGGIPMVNIIQRDPTGAGFFPEWHTTRDDLSVIDKATLQAVGEVLVAFLYGASPEVVVPH